MPLAERQLGKTLFFDIEDTSHDEVMAQLTKAGKVRQVSTSSKNLPLSEKLKKIEKEVKKVLGRYTGFVRCIRSESEFFEYIEKASDVKLATLDTETNNSLDPLTCKIMGLCLYIPNTRPVYVPINHTIPGTDTRLKEQITEEVAREGLSRLAQRGTKLVYHNGKFDIRVIRNTLGVTLPIWWDTMIASQLIDENETARLKYQYKLHVDPTVGTYNIESLFNGISYAWVSPEVFALYSAIDAYDTYLLQKHQQDVFEEEGMENLYRVFKEIEMPIVSVTAKMEDNGVCVDLDFTKKLDDKYKSMSKKYSDEMDALLDEHKNEISRLQKLGKLDNPINFDSPKQLEIVLYDVLKTPVIEESGRSTDKNTLKALKTPFTEAILEYRHYKKLQTAFTETLPKCVSKKDGKIHANFNQMGREDEGVRTGRFSSTDPNLQQIPSKELTVRMLFKARDGYCIVGSDFSAQEPRLLAHMANEPTLKKTFADDKDPYATISQFVFHKSYWECMETHEDGTPNPDGKALRKKAKGLMLGVMYGMGAKLMATSLGVSREECNKILDEFGRMFPNIKEFSAYNEKCAKERGYVEDYLGRRRHLPDAMKDELEVHAKRRVYTDADIFLDYDSTHNYIDIPDEELTALWTKKYNEFMSNGKWNAKNDFKKIAEQNGIGIKDNGAFISKTITQCTNARIQGSAASLTKKAMVAIDNDPIMNKCGFRLLIPVHDELLGECPIENKDIVEKRLTELMIQSAKPECSVGMKCDAYVVKRWYADETMNEIHEEYSSLIEEGNNRDVAIEKISSNYPELKKETIIGMCDGTFDVLSEEV